MKNVWGHDIQVGSVVYRGAREGSSSSYKIGVIHSLKSGKPPRVHWLFEAAHVWITMGDESYLVSYPDKLKNSFGSPIAESLVLINVDMDELERKSDFFNALEHYPKFRDKQEFEDARDSWEIR
jgi:hypothetical protein